MDLTIDLEVDDTGGDDDDNESCSPWPRCTRRLARNILSVAARAKPGNADEEHRPWQREMVARARGGTLSSGARKMVAAAATRTV